VFRLRRRNSRYLRYASSIRVPAAKLDQFVNLVGELVTVQARLVEIAARREDPDVVAVSEEIERLTAALRENSISIRMLPIRATFEQFRRLVHDLARDLHKEVELTIEGADGSKQFLEDSRITLCGAVKAAAAARLRIVQPSRVVEPKLTADAILSPATHAMAETTEKVVVVGASPEERRHSRPCWRRCPRMPRAS